MLSISAVRPRFCALAITWLHPGCLIGQPLRVTNYVDHVKRVRFVGSSLIFLHAGFSLLELNARESFVSLLNLIIC